MSLKVSGRYSQAGWATELDLLREGRREGEREGGSEGERERKISYLKGRKVYLSLQCQPFPSSYWSHCSGLAVDQSIRKRHAPYTKVAHLIAARKHKERLEGLETL